MAFSARTRGALAAVGVPVRIYLGGVFVFASLYKIQEPYEFALSVATYQILPLGVVNLFALIVPWIELVTGVLLIVGAWTKENSLVILGLMAMFLTALLIALSRGYQMSCGCFASQEAAEDIGFHTIFRDLIWAALAAYSLVFDDGRFGADRFLRRLGKHA
jgi:putative oxidoreductase